jgi:hypothetical protein
MPTPFRGRLRLRQQPEALAVKYLVCNPQHWANTKTYGYLKENEHEFHAIGLLVDTPPTYTQDPDLPGVYVGSTKRGTFMATGMDWNLRRPNDVFDFKDGGGVLLKVASASSCDVQGEWGGAGILATEHAWFNAKRLRRVH